MRKNKQGEIDRACWQVRTVVRGAQCCERRGEVWEAPGAVQSLLCHPLRPGQDTDMASCSRAMLARREIGPSSAPQFK